jgi:UDP-N-acetylmuramate--alanine ligase
MNSALTSYDNKTIFLSNDKSERIMTMTTINWNITQQRFHFIGIGGISMSGLAQIMHTRGFKVSGSDMQVSPTLEHLKKAGVLIFPQHDAKNITQDIDVVIYTAAIKADNPELVAAQKLGIPCLTRSVFLGQLMRGYETPICVAGTHGKTTTTSMLATALLSAKLNPTITVGGILNAIHGNIYLGGTDYFLTEACEYYDSFLDFFPKVGIILNIEEDHMDYFKDLAQITGSFQKFAQSIPADGFLAINYDTPQLDNFISLPCQTETFGLSEKADWHAEAITFDEKACAHFDVYHKGVKKVSLTLHVPGKHNVLNALSVCAVCEYLGIDLNLLNEGFKDFTGANQRFEIKGTFNGVTVIDDYAHHPTEIAATLSVAKVYPHKKLFVVFQPHTYSRTKAFFRQFADVLSQIDGVILTDIYAAREKNPGDIHSQDLLKAIKDSGTTAYYMSDFEEIAQFLKNSATSGDVIITMGAGNVNKIATLLLEA